MVLGPFDEWFSVPCQNTGHIGVPISSDLIIRVRLCYCQARCMHILPKNNLSALILPTFFCPSILSNQWKKLRWDLLRQRLDLSLWITTAAEHFHTPSHVSSSCRNRSKPRDMFLPLFPSTKRSKAYDLNKNITDISRFALECDQNIQIFLNK